MFCVFLCKWILVFFSHYGRFYVETKNSKWNEENKRKMTVPKQNDGVPFGYGVLFKANLLWIYENGSLHKIDDSEWLVFVLIRLFIFWFANLFINSIIMSIQGKYVIKSIVILFVFVIPQHIKIDFFHWKCS